MSLTVAKVRQRLIHIFDIPSSKCDLLVRVNSVLEDILELLDNPCSPDVIEMLEVIVETCVHENVSLVISRQIFLEFNSKVLPEMNDTQSKLLALFMLDKMCYRTVSFEEQISNIRLHLSTIYEKYKNWKDAILMLVAIPLESGQKLYSVDYKLVTFIRIARLYLEDEDPLQAESYFNRASILQPEDENRQDAYNLTHARMLDCRQRLIEAARSFSKLLLFGPNLTDDDRIIALDLLREFKKVESAYFKVNQWHYKCTYYYNTFKNLCL